MRKSRGLWCSLLLLPAPAPPPVPCDKVQSHEISMAAMRSKRSTPAILPAMRIFIHEHITGGGLAGASLPGSLATEGRAMLFAIAEDVAALPGASAVITLDRRVEPPPPCASLAVVRIRGKDEARSRFRELAACSDGTLVIAPETGGVLAATVRAVREAGGRHLGSPAEAIERASDKLFLPAILGKADVPGLPAEPWNPSRPPPPGAVVVKPRRGAGSERVVLIDGTRSPPPAREGEDLIATPYIEGIAASVLVIAGSGGAAPLRACAQDLSSSGDFAYLGGRLPLAAPLEARARHLALAAVEAIPGLAGFTGVDLILDRGKDGAQVPRDVVVEVNARLTTSYVGLRAQARTNLASVWLAAVLGRPLPSIVWRPGETRFLADGTVAAGT